MVLRTGVRRVQISNKIDRSTYLALNRLLSSPRTSRRALAIKIEKKDKILLSHGATYRRKKSSNFKQNWSQHLPRINQRGHDNFPKSLTKWTGFKIMITVFACENITWYVYFLPVCLVFTPKNVVLSFVFMLWQTLHTTGSFFPSANLDVLGKQNRRDERRLFMRVRIYFQFNRNSGVELFRRRDP